MDRKRQTRVLRRAVGLVPCIAVVSMTAVVAGQRPLTETIIPVPDPVPAAESLVRLANGVDLWHWDTGGDGEVIVLAHPVSGNAESWMYQQPVFAQAGYRVIAYSRRGFYRSDFGPADDTGTHAGDMALLLDALGVEAAHVLGSAGGGTTALDFTLAFPERTLSATIVASLMSIQEADYQEASRLVRGDWFTPLPVSIKELSPSFRVTYPDGVALWQRIYDLNPPRPDQAPPRQGVLSDITWQQLGRNTVPMLLVAGDADLYMPPELLTRIGERVANAEVIVVDGAGHAVFAEQPARFNELVLDFIAEHSPDAR